MPDELMKEFLKTVSTCPRCEACAGAAKRMLEFIDINEKLQHTHDVKKTG